MNRSEALLELHKKYHTECECRLKETAIQPVFGDGNPDSQVVFIGEAPGKRR
jgi:DNA polymerase